MNLRIRIWKFQQPCPLYEKRFISRRENNAKQRQKWKQRDGSNDDWVPEFSPCGPVLFTCFCGFPTLTRATYSFPSKKSTLLFRMIWFLPRDDAGCCHRFHEAVPIMPFGFSTCCASFLLQVWCEDVQHQPQARDWGHKFLGTIPISLNLWGRGPEIIV